jgi:succinyl-diaminopimelate desuccinylase
MLGDIRDRVEREFNSILETARDLIRIPSRSGDERICAEYIHSRLNEMYPSYSIALLKRPFEHRPQVLMYGDDAKIVLNGHIDTVPEGNLEVWSVDPFSAVVRDGMLYGRGAVDMKSNLALMMHIPRILPTSIALTFAVGEERAEQGSKYILDYLKGKINARYAIVLEPTSLRVCYAQQGALWLKVRVRGKSTHASIPEYGINAIVEASRIIDALESYPLSIDECRAKCSVTMIHAGIKENVIPDECTLYIDRRFTPRESRDKAINEIISILDSLHIDYSMEVIAERSSISIDRDSYIARALYNSCKSLGIETSYECFPASTDNEYFIAEGVEGVVWGAGSLQYAHAVDEHISIDELRQEAYALAYTLHSSKSLLS